MPAKSDKLYNRRKKRALTQSSLQRRGPTLVPRKRLLIVCEGVKTERLYFEAIKAHLNLTSVDIDICVDCGSAPISVVEHAEERSQSEGGPDQSGYDYVFCVFDQDEHESFERAKSKILDLRKSANFPVSEIYACYSNPCFEYWFLLHYKYSRAPLVRTGGKSPGENAVRALRQVAAFDNYDKGLSALQVQELMLRTNVAIENAIRALDDMIQTGADNPVTTVHILVGKLLELQMKQK